MRTIRVYTDQALVENHSLFLTEDTARHLATVLRVKPGQPVALFNGKGGEYQGTVSQCNGKKVQVKLSSHSTTDRESPLQLTLGIGLSRGERMDWVVQKATELGVGSITPLFTERTEVKLSPERAEKKRRHWQKIIISACEQCGRNKLPEIALPETLDAWLPGQSDEHKLVLDHRASKTFTPTPPVNGQATLLVGPEGGFSEAEVNTAINCGFHPLALGPRVMRTETAPIAAISILQLLWGDFSLSPSP